MENQNNKIVIKNIENYHMNYSDGDLILIKKESDITSDKLKNSNLKYYDLEDSELKHSKIKSCNINNKNYEFKKYIEIIAELYKIINNKNLILNNTILNIIEGKRVKGLKYLEKLNISVQGTDSPKSLREIYNISKIGNIDIKLTLKLKNNKIISL